MVAENLRDSPIVFIPDRVTGNLSKEDRQILALDVYTCKK